MMTPTCFVAFGSNVGDLENNYREAKRRLLDCPHVWLEDESRLYRTEPLLKEGQPQQSWYLNAVLKILTTLSVTDLFDLLKSIEVVMGRDGEVALWAPRVVDLDLLFFGDLVWSDKNLSVPHKGIAKRRFVLVPLCDVAPCFVHPVEKLRIQELLEKTPDTLMVCPWGADEVSEKES